jgi:hypothetical protein
MLRSAPGAPGAEIIKVSEIFCTPYASDSLVTRCHHEGRRQHRVLETPNAGSGGVCAGGRAIPTAGCEDLFGFNPTTLNNLFQYNDVGLDGLWGTSDDFMRDYYASVFVLDDSGNPFQISQLLPGECTAIGLGTGCFGFRTAEAAQTSAQFAFAVTTDPISIPERGSLALAGLALAGLAGMRRRKQS